MSISHFRKRRIIRRFKTIASNNRQSKRRNQKTKLIYERQRRPRRFNKVNELIIRRKNQFNFRKRKVEIRS